MTQLPTLVKRFAHLCPSHRRTDEDYADWVLGVAYLMREDDRPAVTEAEKAGIRMWREEAAVWGPWLRNVRLAREDADPLLPRTY